MASERESPESFIAKFSLTEAHLASVEHLSRQQALSLVEFYYDLQEIRKGQGNRINAASRKVDLRTNMDLELVTTLKAILERVEEQVGRALKRYVSNQPLGQWMLQIAGMGETLAASLLTMIDFHRCCCDGYRHLRGNERNNIPKHRCPGLKYAGSIWSFAGLMDPDVRPWGKGQLRPHNPRLKTTCWKIGDAFRKLSVNGERLEMDDGDFEDWVREEQKKKGRELQDDELLALARKKRERMQKRSDKLAGEEFLYVRLYMQYKQEEIRRNESGRYAAAARRRLERYEEKGWSPSAEQRKWWGSGKIQPAGLDLRAMRRAVKVFLSHFHQIGREILFKEKVEPWVIVHGGHDDYIPPPCWPMKK